MFRVSVIIPVFNAGKFLESAVESVINNNYLGEVVLIEDGSPDNSLSICETLCDKFQKVRLVRHPGGENRGAGASRNLGIDKARFEYLSFLDADDFYTPDRFKECECLFSKDPSLDFVYGTSQYESDFINESGRYKRMADSNNVFESLLTGKHGYFDTNSITIKTNSLKRLDKHFNPQLRLHQDSELWLRIAYFLKGACDTKVTPGAVVRQHDLNRITHKNASSLRLFWHTVNEEFKNLPISFKQKNLILLYLKQCDYLNSKSIVQRIGLVFNKLLIKSLKL